MSSGSGFNTRSFVGTSNTGGFSQSNFGSSTGANKITGLTYQEAKNRATLKK
jgi:hypothetical protein